MIKNVMLLPTKMKIYLDMCSLQRPLDSKVQVRIIVEAEAILGIISLVEAGNVLLIASDILTFEAKKIKIPERKNYVFEVLNKAKIYITKTAIIEDKSREFVKNGIKPMDALHLASAIIAEADYFCTCDDRLLRKAKNCDTISTSVVSPTELIMELEL